MPSVTIPLNPDGTPAADFDFSFAVRTFPDSNTLAVPHTHTEELARLLELLGRAPKPVDENWTRRVDLTDDDIHQIAKHLRERHPYRSVRKRLVYETLLPKRPLPELVPTARMRLQKQDRPTGKWASRTASRDGLRARSLAVLHSDNVRQFIKDIDHVAGFAAHAASDRPFGFSLFNGQDSRSVQRCVWRVRQVELVSLLKFGEPRVYLSDQLPKMEELRVAKTRNLGEFEAGALNQLQSGEDIVIDSRLNRIRMLGATRAAKRCLDCHQVHHGELLGAFSYDIVRQTPITDAALYSSQ
ncbi:MAG: hypothetical protein CMJ64_02395 [Planctomycetaceae bacterium]|nr:hypothetical protein [Planctomycetaceae bacterium]